MKEVEGNLVTMALEGDFDVVVHGCNCFCRMRSGIARTISEIFPEACKVDMATPPGDEGKLGTISWAPIFRNGAHFVVVNAYTQFYYGRNKRQVDYDAVRKAMKRIKHLFSGKRIGYPLIGCGLAGGDWTIVSQIINEELEGENHTLVRFK